MEQFTTRLDQILEHFHITSSQFADQIGVPRSSLSHIISGRNNPSLDFIIKIRDAYPTINLYWLIYGFEPFLLENSSAIPTRISEEEINFLQEKNTPEEIEEKQKIILPNEPEEQTALPTEPQPDQLMSEPENIVVLYNDGTFKSYRQR